MNIKQYGQEINVRIKLFRQRLDVRRHASEDEKFSVLAFWASICLTRMEGPTRRFMYIDT